MNREICVYLEIINFFESHMNDQESKLLFLMNIMNKLEQTANEELISNAVILTTNFLTEDWKTDVGVELHQIPCHQKQELISILKQEVL